MADRKLYKTKLCVLYRRGHCSRRNCSFAHGNGDLRPFSHPATNSSPHARLDNQGNDLREKLDRRISPEHTYSLGRDKRTQPAFSGYSTSKSLERKSDREHDDRHNLHEQRHPKNLEATNEFGGKVREGKKRNSNAFLEQLKEVQLNINMLDERKHQLEIYIEEKVQEADSLTSRIQELEAQFDEEKEECKRISSKIKKFVKAHNRFTRAQEEVRRSQTRLHKFGDQLASDTTRNEEDLSINIVSDAETAVHPVLQNTVQGNSSLSKKRSRVSRDAGEVLLSDGGEGWTGVARSKKSSQWNVHHAQSNVGNDIMVVNGIGECKLKNVFTSTLSAEKGYRPVPPLHLTSKGSISFDGVVEVDEKIEVVEVDATFKATGLPFLIPPPPPLSRDNYLQYEGVGGDADVDGLDGMVDVSIIQYTK